MTTTHRTVASIGQYAAIAAIALLFLPHFLSPEFNISWRMISEYAYGPYGIVLSLMFFAWGLAEWCAVYAVSPMMSGWKGRTAQVLLFISGLGATMGGLFDVRHPLHGLAFGIGVPFIPVAALLMYRRLTQNGPNTLLRIVTHGTWVLFLVMGGTMMMFIGDLKAAGAFHPENPQMMTQLPAGVHAVVGYANRALVVVFQLWIVLVNRSVAQKNRQN